MQLYSLPCSHSALETIFHPSKLYSRISHNMFPLNAHTINESQSEKYGLTHHSVSGRHGDFKRQVFIFEYIEFHLRQANIFNSLTHMDGVKILWVGVKPRV